jgi:hypothetical protein
MVFGSKTLTFEGEGYIRRKFPMATKKAAKKKAAKKKKR